MTVVQVSEICIKKGESINLPDSLTEAELAFTVDTGDVFIGAPNLSELNWRRQGQTYSQYPYGNLRLLTELDYAKLISGDVALNVPLQNFNIVSTTGKTIDIGVNGTSNIVPVSATNPMPMFYLPPNSNTAKMDLSIVNQSDNSISIVTLFITCWVDSSSNPQSKINVVGTLPTDLVFYVTMHDTIVSSSGTSTNTNTSPISIPDNENGTSTSTTENTTIPQMVLGYTNDTTDSFTIFATIVCWNSVYDSSAPIPGLAGITSQSNVYANANVINPAGQQGPAGKDGDSFPNDGTTPVNATTVTGTDATFKTLTVTGSFKMDGFSYLPSSNYSNASVTSPISSLVLPSAIIKTTEGFDFSQLVLFNAGNDGYYSPGSGFTMTSNTSYNGLYNVTFNEGTSLIVDTSKGIRFPASTTNSSNYYQIAYDSSVNGLNLSSTSNGLLYSACPVHLAGQTTIDDLIVSDLNTDYITLESATASVTTTVVNNVTETTTVVNGTGAVIGWNLETTDKSLYFVNMLPSNTTGGFRFITYTGQNTIQEKQYVVEIDSSGNIETKGGLLLGEGASLTFSNIAGTGTIIMGYDEKQEAVSVTSTGIVNGDFIFPSNITAKSLTITGTLPITDYSGNIPSTQWVKNYVESTKVNFSNDGTSNIYANSGSFSSIQVNGLATLQSATATTPVLNDNSNNIATTAFVQENIQNYLSNVSLLGYITSDKVASMYVSGIYGMATTDYRVEGVFYSNEVEAPIMIYKDSTGADNEITLLDTTYASNNFVTQTQLNTLFPNNGTSTGNFLSLTTVSLSVTGSSSLGTASASTPLLTDTTNRVATCAYVSGQNYVSGSYGITSGSVTYYGQGLYYDLSQTAPVFVYTDSASTTQKLPLITKAYATQNFITQSSLSSVLSGYVTTTAMSGYLTSTAAANTYATKSQLSGYLQITDANTTYAKQTDLDLYMKTTSAEATFISSSDFTAEMANYVTTSTLSGYLPISTANTTYATIQYVDQKTASGNYATKADLANYTLLTDAITTSNISSYLNGYITISALTPYLKKTDAASTYVTQTSLASSLQNYYTLSVSDNRYIIGEATSASYDNVTNMSYDPTNKYFVISYEDSTGASSNLNVVDKNYVDSTFIKQSTLIPTAYAPWSAIIQFGGVSATITVNSSGYYISGCLCFIWLDATITNLGTGTGNMTISSLPTNATGTFAFPLTVSITKIYSTTLTAYVSNNVINVYGSNGTNTTNMTNTNISVGSKVTISGSYPISLV